MRESPAHGNRRKATCKKIYSRCGREVDSLCSKGRFPRFFPANRLSNSSHVCSNKTTNLFNRILQKLQEVREILITFVSLFVIGIVGGD